MPSPTTPADSNPAAVLDKLLTTSTHAAVYTKLRTYLTEHPKMAMTSDFLTALLDQWITDEERHEDKLRGLMGVPNAS